MKTTAVVFPGQGSQAAGMRELVERERPHLLGLACELAGRDPFTNLDQGTAFLQPAVFCASVAGLGQIDIAEAGWFAGHSMGELAALVAAGCMSDEDGLRLVTLRGQLMQRQAERSSGGGMLALAVDHVEGAALAERMGLALANDNAPNQVVLSGPDERIAEALAYGRERGIKAIRLAIQGSFHSPSMAPIVEEFREAVARVELSDPVAPVISCVTVKEFDDIPLRLSEGLVRGVRWRETVLELRDRGATRFVEAGPGSVLAKIVRRMLPDVEATSVADMEVVGA